MMLSWSSDSKEIGAVSLTAWILRFCSVLDTSCIVHCNYRNLLSLRSWIAMACAQACTRVGNHTLRVHAHNLWNPAYLSHISHILLISQVFPSSQNLHSQQHLVSQEVFWALVLCVLVLDKKTYATRLTALGLQVCSKTLKHTHVFKYNDDVMILIPNLKSYLKHVVTSDGEKVKLTLRLWATLKKHEWQRSITCIYITQWKSTQNCNKLLFSLQNLWQERTKRAGVVDDRRFFSC